MSQEANDILAGRSLVNRSLYQQRIADTAEAQSEQSSPTTYTNFDSELGLGRLKDSSGNISYGQAQTNGAIGKSENIRLRRGGVISGYDSMPRRKSAILAPSIIKKLVGFIVWNTATTRQTGLAIRAVDWFSGTNDRNSSKWKKGTTDADLMPNIKGLKLIYIPLINRSLSTEESKRLKSFQLAGGITFVAGEHADFFQERQKANEIMMTLGSPLRCIDNTISYGGNANIVDQSYPANFKNISILFGSASCEITGGQSISVIPNPIGVPRTNVVWIAYDRKSRTILSGDVNWSSEFTPISGNDNAKFAQSLLKLNW